MAEDALQDLAALIARGFEESEQPRTVLERLFGARYQRRHYQPTGIRDAFSLSKDKEDGVPYAGLVHSDNPPSGPYGGASVVWFPHSESCSLITLIVGTRGLTPDEGLLARPGHKRRVAALRRYLAKKGIEIWSKPDPSALGVEVPKAARERFPNFEKVFQRYGNETYCAAVVPKEPAAARTVVQAFFDLYARERGWQILSKWDAEYQQLHGELQHNLFTRPAIEDVYSLLMKRRFVILQGPPGTGKTRLAEEVRSRYFDGSGNTIQFHPAVTYEDFMIGLSPDSQNESLRFAVREGWLLQAAIAARSRPFLLVIDEVNRADLGKVLGEAIYLFEPDEVGGDRARKVQLPHRSNGDSTFMLPKNLYVLATMNTADRTISNMDIAVRRRFAFVTLPPDRTVIEQTGLQLATTYFDRLVNVFVEHAPDDALDLLPGRLLPRQR